VASRGKVAEFAGRCRKDATGDERVQAQILLDRRFQAFGQPGCLDVDGTSEFRTRSSNQAGGGTAFTVLLEPLLPKLRSGELRV
jgi:hypothetical protein